MRLVWHFDFISPFSYLQLKRFGELPAGTEVALRPLLFAGLLGHYANKGPAEIAPKRVFTYRWVQWYARRHRIPLRFPPAHPFNPLRALRLCIALDGARGVVEAIFDHLWAEGRTLDEPADWARLCDRLGVADADARIAAPAVKAALRENTERAAARGVFGVPTFEAGDRLFWGVDATDMLLDFLADPQGFEDPEMRRVTDLPVGVQRG